MLARLIEKKCNDIVNLVMWRETWRERKYKRNMNILVTGSARMIGGYVAKGLIGVKDTAKA